MNRSADIKDQLEAIESRPLSRAERDALQAPLLALLRLSASVERIKREGFVANHQELRRCVR